MRWDDPTESFQVPGVGYHWDASYPTGGFAWTGASPWITGNPWIAASPWITGNPWVAASPTEISVTNALEIDDVVSPASR